MRMRRLLFVVTLSALMADLALAQAPAKPPASAARPGVAVKYGSNVQAGRTFVHDGVKLYYEVYGTGEPLLVVHGNGGSIGDMTAQIAHFRQRYQVIAMDSRDHGKSADSPDPLTYEKMTDDLAALVDHLKVGPVNVLGWSDGGIEALLLGIRHPAKVKKLVAMAANLNPSDKALHPETLALIKQMIAAVPAPERDTPANRRLLKVTGMMLAEPNIDPKALQTITAPTLVMAGDHDVITDEHTVEIFRNLRNGQLAILPDATHAVLYDNPALFNATVERFLRAPFVKRDRIKDLISSMQKMQSEK
jgi:pimeloyl-ACP methyl ester carboxylesterase